MNSFVIKIFIKIRKYFFKNKINSYKKLFNFYIDSYIRAKIPKFVLYRLALII